MTDFAYDGPIFQFPLSLSYPSSPVHRYSCWWLEVRLRLTYTCVVLHCWIGYCILFSFWLLCDKVLPLLQEKSQFLYVCDLALIAYSQGLSQDTFSLSFGQEVSWKTSETGKKLYEELIMTLFGVIIKSFCTKPSSETWLKCNLLFLKQKPIKWLLVNI